MTTPHDVALEAAYQYMERIDDANRTFESACKAYLRTLLSDPRTREAMAYAVRPELPSRLWYDKNDPTATAWAEAIATKATDNAITALRRIAGVEG